MQRNERNNLLEGKNLPDKPGVYFFLGTPKHSEGGLGTPKQSEGGLGTPKYSEGGLGTPKHSKGDLGEKKVILYIGKATSLKDRVRSYFSQDIAKTRGPKIVRMLELAQDIKWQTTDSVLEALLLESQLIKKHQPPYNTDEKDDKSFWYVGITKETFPRVLLVRGRDIEKDIALKQNSKNTFFVASHRPGEPMASRKTFSLPNTSGTVPEKVLSASKADVQYKYLFGPFPSGGMLKEALRIVRRIFPYREKCTPTVIPGLTRNPERLAYDGIKGRRRYGKMMAPKPCFDVQIGLCPGVCSGACSAKDYAKTIRHIKLFFEGKKSLLKKRLEKEMQDCAKHLEFERANEIKKTLFALDHIQDVALLKKNEDVCHSGSFCRTGFVTASGRLGMQKKVPVENPNLPIFGQTQDDIAQPFRIEAYDAAHFAGKETVGVMTVIENGEKSPSEYRKFKMAKDQNDDAASLREILARRFNHSEWRLPDLIVLDGFDVHMRIAKEVLEIFELDIPIVAVVKDEKHKPKDILSENARAESLAKAHRDVILLANAEAHRFAIAFHRLRRKKGFLQ